LSLYDLSKRDAAESAFRLKSVSLSVQTDEQLAKAREKYPDIKASVSLRVAWEPLLYRKFIGDEQIEEEVDYITMTKSGAVSDEALPFIREAGMKAVHKDMLIGLPNNAAKANPDKQPQAYSRFMVAAIRAGLVVDLDESGQIVSPSVGKIFRCATSSEFPRATNDAKGNFKWDWEDTRTSYLRIPLSEVTDFVQPDEIPEYRYERKEEESSAQTTTSATPAASAEDIAAAVRALGISGKPVALINDQGVNIISSKVGEYRALAPLLSAASQGGLVDALVEKGLATVADGTVTIG